MDIIEKVYGEILQSMKTRSDEHGMINPMRTVRGYVVDFLNLYHAAFMRLTDDEKRELIAQEKRMRIFQPDESFMMFIGMISGLDNEQE